MNYIVLAIPVFLLLIVLELALNSQVLFLILLMVPVILRQAIREESLLIRDLPGSIEYLRDHAA